MKMKTIEVVAAIIKGTEQNANKILATKRGYGEFKGMWEFPGGKMEAGERKEEALIREVKEELDVIIKVNEFVITVEYDYPNFHLILHCYLCEVVHGKLTLLEHEDLKWLTIDELYSVDWLPADIAVLQVIETFIIKYKK